MINSDIMKYKARIASMICNNADIIEALNIKEHKDDPMYNNIYPYLYIPDIQEEVENFICFTVNIPKIDKNEYFKHANLIIYATCHRNDMKTNYGGTRVDVLEGLIVKMFNWNVDIGFKMALVSSEEKIIHNKYHARILTFNSLEFNSLDSGIKHGTPK